MGDRAKIIVEQGKTLTLEHMDISGCSGMWESIQVLPGATLICNDVKFRDAIRAIDVYDGGKVQLTGCKFQNNYIGVHLRDGA